MVSQQYPFVWPFLVIFVVFGGFYWQSLLVCLMVCYLMFVVAITSPYDDGSSFWLRSFIWVVANHVWWLF